MSAARSSRSSRVAPVYKARLSRPVSRGRQGRTTAPAAAKPAPRSSSPRRSRGAGGSLITVPSWVLLLVVFVVLVCVGISAGMSWWWGHVSQENFSKKILFVQAKKPSSDAKIYFALFSSKASDNRLAEIASDQPVTVLGGYGEYPLHAIAPLLAIENKPPVFIRAAYSWALTQLVDQVVVVPAETELAASGQEQLGQLLTSLLLSKQVTLSQKLELLPLWGSAWQQEQLGQTLAVTPVAELGDWPVGGEETPGCSVAIINTTGRSGVASQVSKVMEQSRLRVIRVDDTADHLLQTKVVVSEPGACQPDLAKIAPMWPFTLASSQDAAISNRYRADVVVLVGEDLATLISPGEQP